MMMKYSMMMMLAVSGAAAVKTASDNEATTSISKKTSNGGSVNKLLAALVIGSASAACTDNACVADCRDYMTRRMNLSNDWPGDDNCNLKPDKTRGTVCWPIFGASLPTNFTELQAAECYHNYPNWPGSIGSVQRRRCQEYLREKGQCPDIFTRDVWDCANSGVCASSNLKATTAVNETVKATAVNETEVDAATVVEIIDDDHDDENIDAVLDDDFSQDSHRRLSFCSNSCNRACLTNLGYDCCAEREQGACTCGPNCQGNTVKACSSHWKCNALGLSGNCCPMNDGSYQECCFN